ncbi:MAG: hypothetical protein JW818_09800 [Pirellulales bacterium]|nr:hypothetical protein [Pirellulales bacterium]
MNDPPGDCTWGEYNRLRDRVMVRCAKYGGTPLPVCTGNTLLWSCDELSRAAKLHEGCAKARKDLDTKCFRGGNAGHRHQRAMEWYHAETCWYKYDWWNCGGKPKLPPPPMIAVASEGNGDYFVVY